ncbi:MAG TPA: hypothetical protein PLO67_17565, partial [Saprospiraceae bacterium]|nr:hypothetical protein [Saprospiraceae bacterium]
MYSTLRVLCGLVVANKNKNGRKAIKIRVVRVAIIPTRAPPNGSIRKSTRVPLLLQSKQIPLNI